MKKIILLLLALTNLLIINSCQKDIEAPINTVSVTDNVVPGGSTAIISGTIECPVTITCIELCIDVAEDMPNPTKYDIETTNRSFSLNISNLNDGTTYYYKYKVYTSVDEMELEVRSFTTLPTTIPTVTTNNVSSITTNRAVCGGNVTDAGNLTVTARGVCWSTSPNPTISNSKTADGTGTGSFTSNITGLADGTTYYVRAYATNSKGTAYGEERSFTTLAYINGHDWVDLGLPSGLKWATCNVGATAPEGYGNYYAWGETSTKTSYDLSNSVTYGQQMSDISGNAAYDAARANWGSTWRMPTKTEMQELINNCTWTWTTQNGVNGMKVTGSNGNSIFLPAASECEGTSSYGVGEGGYYWSSTPYESNDERVYSLYFYSGNHYVSWDSRFIGLTVRPVSD